MVCFWLAVYVVPPALAFAAPIASPAKHPYAAGQSWDQEESVLHSPYFQQFSKSTWVPWNSCPDAAEPRGFAHKALFWGPAHGHQLPGTEVWTQPMRSEGEAQKQALPLTFAAGLRGQPCTGQVSVQLGWYGSLASFRLWQALENPSQPSPQN